MIFSLDITSLITGTVIATITNAWFNFYIKQPKLEHTGSGSGNNGDGTNVCSFNLRNKVGWFGVNIKHSILFGLRLHRQFRYGLHFNKATAEDCRAHLLLKETGENLGSLWWRINNNELTQTINIDSGKNAMLMLFAKVQSNPEQYFLYRPTSKDNHQTVVPDQNHTFTGTQEFILKINYSHSLTHEEVIKVERRHNGLLYLVHKNGSMLF